MANTRLSMAEEVAKLIAWIPFENKTVEIFLGMMPHTPDNAIMIKATTGVGPLRTHDGGRSEQLKFQVMVRGTSYDIAYDLARDAWDSFDKVNVALGSSFYQRITQADSIMDIGQDSQIPPRRTFSFNCEAIRSQL